MQELHWKDAKGLEIYARNWPVRSPKAVIAFVHGVGEHFGRYDHLATWYNEHDVAVMGFDQQGHGKSGGVRGHADNLDDFLDDIELFLEKVREHYPKTPLFLYGHSLGAALCLTYVLRRDPILDGLIATSPPIKLAFEAPALKIWAGKLLRRFMPKLTMPTGLAAHFISHDPKVVAAYKADPLVHDKLSAAAAIAILDMNHWLEHFSGVFSIPVLLMHGSDDKITAAAGSRLFNGNVAGDVTYREWPGLWHEMHNEPQKEDFFKFTNSWINKYI